MSLFGRIVRLFAVPLLAFLLGACSEKEPLKQVGYVFGTEVEVQIADDLPEVRARAVMAQVLAEFDRLHRAYHAWQPSELTQLNDSLAVGQRRHVSGEMGDLLLEAQKYARQSDALFDPGIGGLIDLWGFHADSYAARLPDPTTIKSWLKGHPSILQLRIEKDAEGAWVSSANRQVALDFGGSLKGKALDRAIVLLQVAGVRNALVNIGGNVMVLGSRFGKPWRVAIRAPRHAGPLAIIELKDGEAMGTSGDYQRYIDLDGQRYSHLLDPRTGYPAPEAQAVTIVVAGPDAGVRSDILTKPVFIAGESGWQAMANRLGLAQVLRVDADGKINVSAALADRLKFIPHDGKLPDIHRIK